MVEYLQKSKDILAERGVFDQWFDLHHYYVVQKLSALIQINGTCDKQASITAGRHLP